MINGGRDRKRLYLKPIKNPKMKRGRDRNRTIVKNITMFVSEASWRARRKRARGNAKLTQQIHLVSSASTFARIQHKVLEGIIGSTRSDVMGPVTLDAPADLPTMPLSEKKVFYGKRFVLSGGRVPDESDDSSDDEDDDDDHAEDTSDPPVSHHCLPITVALALIKAHNIKHVIDLSPSPLKLAYKVLALGGSYVGLCATSEQAEYLKKQLFADLIQGVVNKDEKLLYDNRFSAEAAAAGPSNFMRAFQSKPHMERFTAPS